MAGYTRQSTADIVSNAVIKAAPVNAEYNAIRDAFAFATGHKHDGSSTEGAYIPLIADTDALNKVVIDTTNNRIGFFVQVGNGTVEQLRIQDGAFVPVSDSDIDLGASGAEFKDLYIDGVGYIDTVTVHENATIAGTLGVTGLSTLASVDINGGNIDATVIGAATPAAATVTTLVATTADINAGTVDATIGGTTPAAGTFTAVTTTTADINGGTVDGTIIGGATPAAGTFTAVVATTADINGGTVDNATIGASTPTTIIGTTITGNSLVGPLTGNVTGNVSGNLTGNSAGVHTGAVTGNVTGNLAGNVTSTGTSTLATVDINAGNVDGTAIGAATPSTVVGTTVTATNFVGPIAGAVTGNVTGNTAGVHTGAVTGNVTGNIASTGSSSFTDLTINGSLNMNAGTSGTITGLSNPVQGTDAATKTYVDAKVAAVVDSAPAALDTLNELAAALGDDANYASTTTAAIATKLPKAGGTMTGAIAMGNNKVTGLGAPTAGTDAAHKTYVDGVDALKLAKSGDTMSGVLAMGANKITGVANPTAAQDVVTKSYSDTLFGSTAAAATSASNAATSASNASTSETNAAASYDSFDDRYLGAKSSNPTVDNDGNALIVGSLHWNTTANTMRVWNGSIWKDAGSTVNGTSERVLFTATAGQTTFAVTYDAGFADVYLNGVKLLLATDYTATNGTSIVLASGATVGDSVDIVSYSAFVLTDHHTKTAADARFLGKAGGTMTGDTLHGDNVKAKFGTGNDLTIHHDGSNSYIIDNGTGDLIVLGNNVQLRNTSFEYYLTCNTDAGVTAYHNNAAKLATTSTGIDVTGTVTADGLTTSGDLVVNTTGNTPVVWANTTGSGKLSSWNKGGAEKAFITNNGGASFGSNVDVTGTVTADGLTVDGVSTLNNHVKIANGYSLGWGDISTRVTGNATADTIQVYTDAKKRANIAANGDISFYEDTGTNAKFFWDASAESLGIGTSSPASILALKKNANGALGPEITLENGFGSAGSSNRVTFKQDQSTSFIEGTLAGAATSGSSLVLGTSSGNSAGTERLRLDTAGNLGLGVVPSTSWHSNHVALQLGGGKDGFISAPKGQNIGRMFMGVNAVSTDANGNNWSRGGDTYRPSLYSQINGVHAFKTAAAGSGAISWNTAMTIDNARSILIGRPNAGWSDTQGLALNQGNSGENYVINNGVVFYINRGNTEGKTIRFYKSIGTEVGNISTFGASTAYNTSSDYRIKTDVQPITAAADRVKLLKPCNFEWIADGSRADGFLAHELAEVVPIAVTGAKDAMEDEEYEVTPATGDIYTAGTEAGYNQVSPEVVGGPAYYDINGVQIRAEIIAEPAVHEAFDAVAEVIHSSDVEQPETLEDGQAWRETTSQVMATRSVPDMQGIDQSKLTPIIVATLQEALAEIESLKTRLTALEE